MALIRIDFFSQALSGQTELYALLPTDVADRDKRNNPHYQREPKLIVLLHGYSGNASDWVTGSPIRELAVQYNLAVLMPNGRNSFYIDKESTGEKYATYVGKELPDFAAKTFGLDTRPENCVIGGFSMGGFGAIHTGLLFDTYSKIIGLSNALIVNDLATVTEDHHVANRAYYEAIFGNLETAKETEHNTDVLVNNRRAAGKKLPGIWMACGSGDFLIESNNAFDEFLTAQGVPHEYHVSPGIHNWKFWNSCLEPAIRWAVEA